VFFFNKNASSLDSREVRRSGPEEDETKLEEVNPYTERGMQRGYKEVGYGNFLLLSSG